MQGHSTKTNSHGRLADPRPCLTCGEKFQPTILQLAKGHGKFCSMVCYGMSCRVPVKYNAALLLADPRPCLYCGKLFQTRNQVSQGRMG